MSKFQDHVTSTAFSLTLSRRMISGLAWAYEHGFMIMGCATYRALLDRGLIALYTAEEIAELNKWYHQDFTGHMRLTKAGQLMIPVLQECGLWPILSEPSRPLLTPDEKTIIDVSLKERCNA